MKITKQRLKQIIREELNEAANPEWDSADKILRDLVYLAQDLEDSTSAEPAALASAIVDKLREAVDAMEARLIERFAEDEIEDEISDEEALVLKGPRFDPLGDSLSARRQRASVRRGK
tara:strand:- start:82 stop:435 length:354 start_codon:yes stop_codon:yes gene_type:complete